MRATIEIFLAIIFTILFGPSIMEVTTMKFQAEALKKVDHGISSLSDFTQSLVEEK